VLRVTDPTTLVRTGRLGNGKPRDAIVRRPGPCGATDHDRIQGLGRSPGQRKPPPAFGKIPGARSGIPR